MPEGGWSADFDREILEALNAPWVQETLGGREAVDRVKREWRDKRRRDLLAGDALVMQMHRDRALSGGGDPVIDAEGHVTPSVEWHVAGKCLKPVNRLLWKKGTVGSVQLLVKCRRCVVCLKDHARQWAGRATNEALFAPRTWFVTFTMRQAEQDLALYKAQASKKLVAARSMAKVPARVVDYESMSEREQFAARCHHIQPEITKWLKRVRAGGGLYRLPGGKESREWQPGVEVIEDWPETHMRYCLVAEAHRSGAPHFHALVHEVHGCAPLSERRLRRNWKAGFLQAKLVRARGDLDDPRKVAWYVCKYLSKDVRARVRASQFYGKGPKTELPTQRANKVQRVNLTSDQSSVCPGMEDGKVSPKTEEQ